MDSYDEQILDSPSKNSYIGSYYNPPDRIRPLHRELEPSTLSSFSGDPHTDSPGSCVESKAVMGALKTLQEKIRRLELERKQAEKSHQQLSQEEQRDHTHHQPETSRHKNRPSNKRGLDSKLQSAESRCKLLEKQLDYMRDMVENAKKEKHALRENQAYLEKQRLGSSDSHIQQEKLQKLESECLTLSRTQALAEMKLTILEEKLLKEEHERRLLQDKAGQLQRELERTLRLDSPASEETKPKKKIKRTPVKVPKPNELAAPPNVLKLSKMPFVAGMSTSPSHSVHANVQSILHMMKHHQPQLCERVSALQRPSGGGGKKDLQKDFSPAPDTFSTPDKGPERADQQLGSLYDLLLALQDELGQMSFEHRELVHQIDAAQHRKQRQDLQRELERLVDRMEEKGAQITKLRKYQETVHKRSQNPAPSPSSGEEEKKPMGAKTPLRSPTRQKAKLGASTQKSLQILRETQKFRSSLQKDNFSWET